jgi:hypothetical protein
MPDINFDK